MQKIDLQTFKRLLCDKKVSITLSAGKRQAEIFWDSVGTVGTASNKKKERDGFILFCDDRELHFADCESMLPFLRKKGFIGKNDRFLLLEIEERFATVEEYENFRDVRDMTFAERIDYFKEQGCDRISFYFDARKDRLQKEEWARADAPFSQAENRDLYRFYLMKLKGKSSVTLEDLEKTFRAVIVRKDDPAPFEKLFRDNYYSLYALYYKKISREAFSAEESYREKTDERRMEEAFLTPLLSSFLGSEYTFATDYADRNLLANGHILVKKISFSLDENAVRFLKGWEEREIMRYDFFAGEKRVDSYTI